MKKICTKCKIEKPLDGFYNNKSNTSDGKHSWCKRCFLNEQRLRIQKNPEKKAASDRKYHMNNREEAARNKWFKKYKGTEEQYQHYLTTTHCECCGLKFGDGQFTDKKHQDHDHATGEIRKVLCGTCNVIEGKVSTEQAYDIACYKASLTPLKELINGI